MKMYSVRFMNSGRIEKVVVGANDQAEALGKLKKGYPNYTQVFEVELLNSFGTDDGFKGGEFLVLPD